MRRHLFILLLPVLFPAILQAQTVPSDDTAALFEPPTYDSAEMAQEMSYPKEELEDGREMKFGLAVLIDSTGRLITNDNGRGRYPFVDAVEDALRSHEGFRPGRLNGTPVNSRFDLTVDFTVDDDERGSITWSVGSSSYGPKVDELMESILHPDPASKTTPPSYDPNQLMRNVSYPESALADNIQGEVRVCVEIDQKGTITKAWVCMKVDPELDQAALDAVKKTQFTPAIQNGAPIRALMTIPVTFVLSD